MKHTLILFLLLLSPLLAYMQGVDPVAIRINDKPIYKSEVVEAFERQKTNGDSDFNSFIESYVDYRLNLEEALAEKIDTSDVYKRNYSTHRIQLSENYTTDNTIIKKTVEKVYDRMLRDLEINHTMLTFDKDVLFPGDTLELYTKAIQLRNEILKKGFKLQGMIDNTMNPNLVTNKSTLSGYLGWVTPFLFPTSVEDALYSLPLKKVSMPIRSNEGYHIVQVLSKRPTRGIAEVEQVIYGFHKNGCINIEQQDALGKAVNSIYQSIKKDTSLFESLCINSKLNAECTTDTYTQESKIPQSMVTAIYGIEKNGDVSLPIQTSYGYHIVKLKDRSPLPPLSEIESGLANKIMRSDRSLYFTRMWDEKYNKMYKLEIDKKVYAELKAEVNETMPLNPEFVQKLREDSRKLFTINGDAIYQVKNFSSYLTSKIQPEEEDFGGFEVAEYVTYSLSTDKLQDLLDIYTSRAISAYIDSTLEVRVPEFNKMMQLYSEGVLLFELKNKHIWNKAQKDEAGLLKYYESNKAKYEWSSPRYKGAVFHCKTQDVATSVSAMAEKTKNTQKLLNQVKDKINSDSTVCIYKEGVWAKGENEYVDNYVFGAKEPKTMKQYPYWVAVVNEIKAPESYKDVKSLVEIDYQEYLEREWTEWLRKKYKVEVDNSIIKTIN